MTGAGALNEVVLMREECVVDACRSHETTVRSCSCAIMRTFGTGRVKDAISVSACCVEGDLLEKRVGEVGLKHQDVTQLAGAS